MARPRSRYDELGRPKPCSTVLPPELAVYIYQERRAGDYVDETELVCAIVREWVKLKKLPKVDWKTLVTELMNEDKQQQQIEESAEKNKKKGKAG